MSTEYVLDASILAKCIFDEEDSLVARRRVASITVAVAPDFILVELASIAAKKVRRGQESADRARNAFGRAHSLLTILTPAHLLAAGAFELAVRHGVSAYDGLYLQLALQRERPVLTADQRLVVRVGRSGLGRLVATLDDV